MSFSPDGRTLAGCRVVVMDTVKLWDVETEDVSFSLSEHTYLPEYVQSVSYSADGSHSRYRVR